ncbi:YdgH/BhsA/McbA-like domain containing protein [Pantoea sp. 1.19]|uniref:multiple stress resistance protein BhsA n=1 Tax=Pantoea sp. 1.19 TaxID=1925589 RepID=UPI000948D51E|nr:YdgH/BhsA/McbA-like domain containing protein [Pantoea sp. 1.19]
MKTIKYFAAAIAISTAFAATAADEINRQDAGDRNKIGVVSATGATTLNDLQTELAQKAKAAGASAYSISSVRGDNLLSGSATLYN